MLKKTSLMGLGVVALMSLSAPSFADRYDVCAKNDNPNKCADPVSVPEPGTLGLLGLGLVGAALAKRKRKP